MHVPTPSRRRGTLESPSRTPVAGGGEVSEGFSSGGEPGVKFVESVLHPVEHELKGSETNLFYFRQRNVDSYRRDTPSLPFSDDRITFIRKTQHAPQGIYVSRTPREPSSLKCLFCPSQGRHVTSLLCPARYDIVRLSPRHWCRLRRCRTVLRRMDQFLCFFRTRPREERVSYN